MKRKDIEKTIELSNVNDAEIRDSVLVYRNTIELIMTQSDKSRCDFYDQFFLYLIYGIEPNLDAFSVTKKAQFRYIFSLLKKQRIGFLNSLKSSSCKNLPQGYASEVCSEQVIKNKEDNLLNNKIEEEETSGASAPPPDEEIIIDFDALVNHYNETTKGVFGKLTSPLSDERIAKITELIKCYHGRDNRTGKNWFVEAYTKAAKSDFLKGSNDNNWRMTFDWMLEPKNFGKILSGNYDKLRKSSYEVDLDALK